MCVLASEEADIRSAITEWDAKWLAFSGCDIDIALTRRLEHAERHWIHRRYGQCTNGMSRGGYDGHIFNDAIHVW